MPAVSDAAKAHKRKADRERLAAKRARMTEEERRAKRVEYDANYRQVHHEARREYDRQRARRRAESKWAPQERPATAGESSNDK